MPHINTLKRENHDNIYNTENSSENKHLFMIMHNKIGRVFP